MKMKRDRLANAILALALLTAGVATANNLQIENTTVVLSETQDGTAYVKFDISWENSWRYETDDYPGYLHDAAWVFLKVRPAGGGEWTHVKLNTAGTDPVGTDPGTAGANLELVVPSDRMGVFVRRSAAGAGAGTLASTNVTLRWHITDSGVASSQTIEMRAFGLEMAYVAEGSFQAGDLTAGFLYPTLINTNDPAVLDFDLGNGYQGGRLAASTVPTAGANFPNGYKAFYMMKYILTQGSYADFANSLTETQATNRMVTAGFGTRTTFSGSWPNITPNQATRAMITRWENGIAFADWSGLRPYTQLEFEKACRGPLTALPGEYAWGTTAYVLRSGTSGSDGSGTETYTPANANTYQIASDYPYRVGAFMNPGSTREEGGASFWGIAELTGNVYERPVTLSSFDGLHGDGVLDALGNANTANWPIGTGNNSVAGAHYRGGPYSTANYMRVGDTSYAGASYDLNTLDPGWRGARSAP